MLLALCKLSKALVSLARRDNSLGFLQRGEGWMLCETPFASRLVARHFWRKRISILGIPELSRLTGSHRLWLLPISVGLFLRCYHVGAR